MSWIGRCGREDVHAPHWITKPPPGVMGGQSCTGEASEPIDFCRWIEAAAAIRDEPTDHRPGKNEEQV